MCRQVAVSADQEAASRALYAAAALMRNNPKAQASFKQAGGLQSLQQTLEGNCRSAVQRRAITIALDLHDSQSEVEHLQVYARSTNLVSTSSLCLMNTSELRSTCGSYAVCHVKACRAASCS